MQHVLVIKPHSQHQYMGPLNMHNNVIDVKYIFEDKEENLEELWPKIKFISLGV